MGGEVIIQRLGVGEFARQALRRLYTQTGTPVGTSRVRSHRKMFYAFTTLNAFLASIHAVSITEGNSTKVAVALTE